MGDGTVCVRARRAALTNQRPASPPRYLGHVKIDLATKKVTAANVILLGGPASASPWPEDPAVVAVIDKYRAPVKKISEQPAGRLPTAFVCAQRATVPSSQGVILAACAGARAETPAPKARALSPPRARRRHRRDAEGRQAGAHHGDQLRLVDRRPRGAGGVYSL